jgi:hypothetical protein
MKGRMLRNDEGSDIGLSIKKGIVKCITWNGRSHIGLYGVYPPP